MIPGLSQQEVERRRKDGQGNVSASVSSRSYLHIVRKNVFTFVNMVLLIIGALLMLLGSPSDATTTAGLVVMNVLVGVVQEIRAKRKLDHITLLTRPRVTVIREGQAHAVDASELVLGDVISVTPGDQIVCDGRILSESHVEVDESLLTGESDYIPKQNGDTVYSGSFCVSGSALYEATQVGKNSLANVLTAKARRFKISVTPLQRDVNTIVRSVGVACGGVGRAAFGAGGSSGYAGDRARADRRRHPGGYSAGSHFPGDAHLCAGRGPFGGTGCAGAAEQRRRIAEQRHDVCAWTKPARLPPTASVTRTSPHTTSTGTSSPVCWAILSPTRPTLTAPARRSRRRCRGTRASWWRKCRLLPRTNGAA